MHIVTVIIIITSLGGHRRDITVLVDWASYDHYYWTKHGSSNVRRKVRSMQRLVSYRIFYVQFVFHSFVNCLKQGLLRRKKM